MEKWRGVWIYEPGYGKEACVRYGKLGIIGEEMLMNEMRPMRSQSMGREEKKSKDSVLII